MSHPTHIERLAGRESAARGRMAQVIGHPDDTVPAVAAARGVGGGSAPWAVGHVVAGRFVLQQRLGRGRYGPIFKALDRTLSEALIGVEHQVALQELDPRIATQPILLERLENLPLHPQSWSHPNLVKLLEFGRDGAKYFLSEELLEGASFRLVLDESPQEPLTYDEVLAVLRGVGDALNYAHAKGIVHGDIRPQNVFVTERYNIKLLDLLPGNEPRPAPFFAEDAGSDHQPHPSDDVYGAACLAYELLTGRHPYNGNSPLEALRAGLAPQPVTGLPPVRWQALSRGLALRRERRTAGVPELLAGLGVTGTETLRRPAKTARPKPAETRQAELKPAETPSPAWPEITMPPMDVRQRGAVGAAAPAAVVGAPPHRPAQPALVKLAFDAETPAPTRRRARRRSNSAVMAFGAALAAALAVVAYRDHSRLVIQGADLIEVSSAFATEEVARWRARYGSATPTRRAAGSDVSAVARDNPAAPSTATTDPAPTVSLATVPLATVSAASTPDDGVAQAPAPPTAAPTATEAARAVRPAELPAPLAVATTASSATPQFKFAERTVTVSEGDALARIEILRTGSLEEEASVVWSVADRTALADEDYAVLGARIASFAAGEESRVVYVPLIADSVAERRETFVVTLRADRSGAGAAAQLEVVVLDDDS